MAPLSESDERYSRVAHLSRSRSAMAHASSQRVARIRQTEVTREANLGVPPVTDRNPSSCLSLRSPQDYVKLRRYWPGVRPVL
jgi:hypothetical protein